MYGQEEGKEVTEEEDRANNEPDGYAKGAKGEGVRYARERLPKSVEQCRKKEDPRSFSLCTEESR